MVKAQPNSNSEEDILNVNVGVLGHVDSGKTSLVKTLSTLLSTAALDKSKESRMRGMTLDLGFSCFFVDDMPLHLKQQYPNKTKLQITLVDCPGHASLIRTIIGGASIIDMVLLVVDSFKGWQTQTTECLVLAELTSPHLVVALNKVDLFSEQERDEKLQAVKQDIWKRLASTRFQNASLVPVAACVGGEKVAACTSAEEQQPVATSNVDELLRVLVEELPPPKRTPAGPFYFSIDHCFPIRGQGTVLTGTVLSGSISINDTIEFPTLSIQRKIKSMQMFRRATTSIQQGDRAGICISNFDAKLLERGVCSTPNAVQLLKGAIALVRKVPYYAGTLKNGSKFHISVGHATIMATTTFWGARELQLEGETPPAVTADDTTTNQSADTNLKGKQKKGATQLRGHSSLGGDADLAGLPRIPFDFDQDFIQQDGLLEPSTNNGEPLLHWALLEFQTPVYCPLDSLAIGSRLDTTATTTDNSSSCRLAFSGRLVEKADPARDASRIRLYTPKEKRGVISRLGDAHRREDDQKVVRYEVFGSDLFKKETNMKLFVGMKLVTEKGEVGEIKSSFGTAGKFRVYFPAGTEAREGDALILKFKRYLHDSAKAMHQDVELPKARVGTRLEVKKKQKKPKVIGEVVTIKGDVLENGKHDTAIIAGFFTPEVNIRERIGTRVFIPSTNEEGKISGSFGKAGKCKVAFEKGISAEIGAKAELLS